MKESSYIVLKSILDTNQNFKRLSTFLHSDILKNLDQYDVTNSFDYLNFSTEKILDLIHYSWLIPTFENLDKDTSFCISALSPKVQAKLKKQFKLESSSINISSIAKEYVILVLLSSLMGSDDTILPIQYLPYSPINILATKTKEELINVINFLALIDLNTQLKKTLNTSTIKMIYKILNKDEKIFLKKVQSFKDPLSFSSFLEKWDGNEENFRKILHKRGLYRFGLALSFEHPDLIWYICHILDIGRGSSLMKMCEKKINSVISNTMQSHILEIVAIP
jgi:hypothetical protein